MIGKVCRRGADVRRLLFYLFTEGLAGQHGLDSDHTDAHLIAGWDDPRLLEPPRQPDGRRDLRRLAGLLNAPLALAELAEDATPVYHLAISAAKDPDTGAPRDRLLSDAEWADVAAEYLDRIGLAPRGDPDGVRWVAVRHAPDHIHVVATLARQDGKRVWPYRDFLRSREASHAVEARYGLVSTAPADGTGTPETTRAEHRRLAGVNAERAERGLPAQPAPDRDVLRRQVRTALAGSDNLEQFLDRLRTDGVLVRERFSTLNPDEITGYAVALPHRTDNGQPIWFGGGKLAPDLTLPQLQRRWQQIQPGVGKGAGPVGKTRDASGSAAGKTMGDQTDSAGGTDRVKAIRDPDERARVWAEAVAAAVDGEAELRSAAQDAGPGGPAGGPAQDFGANPTPGHADWDGGGADDLAGAAADLMTAAARLGDGQRHHHRLTDAAEAFDRAARRGRAPARRGTRSAGARRMHSAARELLSLRVALPRETRQFLALIDQLSRLAQTLEQLRAAQGRAAQAAAARATQEKLLLDITERTPAPPAAAPPTVAWPPSRHYTPPPGVRPSRGRGTSS